ncbi:PAS domain S-box protein [Zhouia sp. PK063]|uniref:PAS domain S-box protein n=1 Tax=Zhouia sp. PK063 TaxID=3373602 RepID=UPI0037A29B0C
MSLTSVYILSSIPASLDSIMHMCVYAEPNMHVRICNKEEQLKDVLILYDAHDATFQDVENTVKAYQSNAIVLLLNEEQFLKYDKFYDLGVFDCIPVKSFNEDYAKKIFYHSEQYLNLLNANLSLKKDYKNIFDRNPFPMAIFDKETLSFINVNEAAIHKYGYSKEEFKHITLKDIHLEEEHQKLRRILSIPKTFGHIGIWEHITKRGSRIKVDVSIHKVTYKGKGCVLALATDVTKKLESLQKERENNQKFEAIFKYTTDAIVLINNDNEYIDCNPAAEQLFGYTKEELLNKKTGSFISADQKFPKTISKNHFDKLATQKHTVEYTRKNGSRFYGKFNSVENILPGLHLSVITDVTNIVLEQRKNELSNLIYQAAHAKEKHHKKINKLTRKICKYINWHYAELWLNERHTNKFVLEAKCINTQSKIFDKLGNATNFELVEEQVNILKEVAYNKGTIWWNDIKNHPKFFRSNLVEKEGVTTFAVPLFDSENKTEITGAIVFYNEFEIKKNELLVKTIESITPLLFSELSKTILEKQYVTLFDKTNDLISFSGMHGYFTEVNRSWEKITGYTKDELKQLHWKDLAAKEDHALIDEIIIKLQKGKNIKKFILPIFTKNKEKIWLSWNINSNLKTKTLYAISRDITKAKVEKTYALKLLDELSHILDSSLDIICTIDKTGKFLRTNNATERILGFTKEEFLSKNYFDIVHDKDLPATKTIFNKVLKGDKIRYFENTCITKNGKALNLQWSKKLDEKSDQLYFVGRDVTDLNETKNHLLKINEALKISNERFDSSLKATNEAIWDYDLKAGTVYWSDSFERVYGYKLRNNTEAIEGWIERIYEGDKERVSASFDEAINEKKHVWIEEYYFKNANGKLHYVLDRGYLIFDAFNNPVRIVGAMMDITELKNKTKTLEIQNNRLKHIAWLQSHKLRAPLANILGLIDLLTDVGIPYSDEEKLDILHKLQASSEQLDAVITTIVKKAIYVELEDKRM